MSKRNLSFSIIILLPFLFMVLSCKSNPVETEVVQNWGTGEISRRYKTIDGKKEGLMTDYYQDGSLKAERWFKNDIQVGKTTLYHKNGKIKEVQYYDQGTIHGGDTTFYESGAPEMLLNFDHGVKHGYVRKWLEDGTMIYEARYSHDTLVEVKGEMLKRDSLIQ
jgi:antitoxin component YwqK of YwqJK toxin-antitoxin module